MWWNFVGRSGEEIADYAEQWNAESARFGAVVGYDGDRLEAPPLPPVPLKARGAARRLSGMTDRPAPARAFVAENKLGRARRRSSATAGRSCPTSATPTTRTRG